jgi:CheY-like chemotaxis protein
MDIRMPLMNGWDATKIIRNSPKADAKTVPILAMTANAFENDIQTSLQCGMNGHLSKPIEPEQLYACLATCIAQRKQ